MGKKKRKDRQAQTGTLEQSVEAAALSRYQSLLSPQDFQQLQAELAQPLRSAIRLNPLKPGQQSDVTRLAARYGWETLPVPYCPAGWWVENARTAPSMTIEHRLGFYYIQDAASMLPAELFDLDTLTDPLILDMAASPGGKTTHLASRTGDRGILIANDSSRDRIIALRMVLQNWGVLSAAVTQFPGEKFGAWFPETFDRVLLDAPCSMESLRSTASHRMRPITPRERDNLAKRQTQLLASALSAVKTGGQVVYSTCTLAPEEDEAVLDRLLQQYPGVFRVEDVSHRLPVHSPGLAADERHAFTPQAQNAVRLFPHHYRTAGFFAALLRKESSLNLQVETVPARPLERTAFSPLDDAAFAGLAARMMDAWGFDLHAILEKNHLCLWKNESRIFAFSQAYLDRFASFPCKSLGLVVGEDKSGEFIPAAEWVARFAQHFRSGIYTIAPDQVEAWERGEDLPAVAQPEPHNNVCIVQDEDGRLLGTGRTDPERLHNLLPRRAVLSA